MMMRKNTDNAPVVVGMAMLVKPCVVKARFRFPPTNMIAFMLFQGSSKPAWNDIFVEDSHGNQINGGNSRG